LLLVGIGPVIAETRYSPFPPAETAQRIAQVFQRHGLARLSPPGAVTVSSAQPERVRLVVESPARVVDASRCRWQDAYGRPITLEIHRDAQGVTWIDYRLPPKRVNAFGVIECGKTRTHGRGRFGPRPRRSGGAGVCLHPLAHSRNMGMTFFVL